VALGTADGAGDADAVTLGELGENGRAGEVRTTDATEASTVATSNAPPATTAI
jgi:hypothetical protein